MTVAEERFYTNVPLRLDAIENHLEKIANCLERLTELVTIMYNEEDKEEYDTAS